MRPLTRNLAAAGTFAATIAGPAAAQTPAAARKTPAAARKTPAAARKTPAAAPQIIPSEFSLQAATWTSAGSSAAFTLFAGAGRAIARAERAHAAAAARASATTTAVRRMIGAGNRIARLPYAWGGGHGSFTASGYDCSGSVSFVLHAAGLISTPEDSVGLESFGDAGPGRHVTVYANGQHAWMTIDGRRFDTISLQETGTRWSRLVPTSAGYVVRHPAGL